MRIPFLSAAACIAIGAAVPAAGADRNFGVSGFDRVRVDGPYKVKLVTGVAPFAIASGSPAALDSVALDVQGRTLIVRTSRSSWGGYPGESTGPVTISIGTHDLSAAWLNGAGSLAIDKVRGLSFDLSVEGSGAASIALAEVDQLKVSIAGTGSASIAGTAPKLTAMVRGVSSLDASALSVKDETIGAQGPATVKAMVTNSAKVDAQGPAVVDFAGSPACTTTAEGSATVSGCGSSAY